MYHSISDYQKAAKALLPVEVYDYINSAAGDGITARQNEEVFDQLYLCPRVLKDVATIDTSTIVLGKKIDFPVMIAPTAFHQLVDKHGEISTAKAAKASSIPMVMSTMSNYPMQDICQQSAYNDIWLQTYLFKDRELTESLMHQAEALGCRAIVLTVGVPCSGIRYQDIRNQFKIPTHLGIGNLKQRMGKQTISEFVTSQLDASITWDDVAWLQTRTQLPIYLKGILNSEDAEKCCQMALAGIVVSNHGGRQLDTAIPSLTALAELSQIIDGRLTILVDGGIRRGSDIFKACALGADAVMLGRPVFWALAVGGTAALINMLAMLRSELVTTMKLTGCQNMNAVRAFSTSLHNTSSLADGKKIKTVCG